MFNHFISSKLTNLGLMKLRKMDGCEFRDHSLPTFPFYNFVWIFILTTRYIRIVCVGVFFFGWQSAHKIVCVDVFFFGWQSAHKIVCVDVFFLDDKVPTKLCVWVCFFWMTKCPQNWTPYVYSPYGMCIYIPWMSKKSKKKSQKISQI
jgi:hypothetical protein